MADGRERSWTGVKSLGETVIYMGTSGYSYEDWAGVFYPAGLARHERFSFYATEFDAVEINYTYYRLPTAEHLSSLSARTGSGFRFAVKAHQDITHRRDKPPVFAQFRQALAPLQRSGQLGAVLLQFPNSFRNQQRSVEYLDRCIGELAGLPLVVEFRHDSWIAQRTLSWLRERQVGFCNVDMPALPGLLPRTAWVTGPVAYVRLHGRNEKKWWNHEQAWERYDYSYDDDELAEWLPHLGEMEEQAQEVYLFANNHWEGQSVSTIRQLRILFDRQDRGN